MTNAGFFRGTTAEQDFRFSNKQSKSRKEFKFPPLDTTKINIESLKPWILDRIKNVLENDDELMSDAILEFFSEKEVDGSAVSQFISGFADSEKTNTFIQEVWTKFNEVKEESSTSQPQPVKSVDHDKSTDLGCYREGQQSSGPSSQIDDSTHVHEDDLEHIRADGISPEPRHSSSHDSREQSRSVSRERLRHKSRQRFRDERRYKSDHHSRDRFVERARHDSRDRSIERHRHRSSRRSIRRESRDRHRDKSGDRHRRRSSDRHRRKHRRDTSSSHNSKSCHRHKHKKHKKSKKHKH